jgi:hypothetical protein
MTYDSSADTCEHIKRVQVLMYQAIALLQLRALKHDLSKLEEPEKSGFDKYTPLLRDCTYGSDEYKTFLTGLGESLKHHYENNSHHPEHYMDGIKGMSLLDIVEMFCDWKAATERHADGSLDKSIGINKKRFNYDDTLECIFQNTRRELGW